MSEVGTPEPPTYLWYQAGNWTNLEQGDLLPNCPVLVPPATLANDLFTATEGDEIDIQISLNRIPAIVMSQSCDLAHDKISQVLLCGYFPASRHGRDRRADIRKERFPALHMLERCELPRHDFEQQVVDFRALYTLPKDFVTAFAISLGERVRLLSPYKEHLSQAFARYFMRVGLPRPLSEG